MSGRSVLGGAMTSSLSASAPRVSSLRLPGPQFPSCTDHRTRLIPTSQRSIFEKLTLPSPSAQKRHSPFPPSVCTHMTGPQFPECPPPDRCPRCSNRCCRIIVQPHVRTIQLGQGLPGALSVLRRTLVPL